MYIYTHVYFDITNITIVYDSVVLFMCVFPLVSVVNNVMLVCVYVKVSPQSNESSRIIELHCGLN